MRFSLLFTLGILLFIGSSGTIKAQCTAPTTQASNITISNITNTSATITVTRGNGGGRVVYLNTSTSFFTPVTGKIPVVSTVYAGGQQCIYDAQGGTSGTTFTINVTGLSTSTIYNVRAFEYCLTSRVYSSSTSTNNPRSFATTACPTSSAPTTITSASAVCSGGSVILTASGGVLGTNASVEWFAGTCGSTVLFRGNPFTVTPAATTTYYARYSNGCNSTGCVSKTITVNPKPNKPLITANQSTLICAGDSVTLSGTTSGVSSYLWSTGQTTTSIVSKTANTYSVTVTAANGCTSISDPISVFTGSAAYTPTAIRGVTTICSGDSASLTAMGGTMNPGGNVQWFTGSCGGNLVYTGNPFKPAPGATTTYYARYSGGCNCVSSTVTVKPSPATPVLSASLASPTPGTLTYANDLATFETGNGVRLAAPNNYASYLWSNGIKDSVATFYTSGTATLQVANAAGCKKTTTVTLKNNYYNQQRIDSINNFCSGGGFSANTTGFSSLSLCDDCYLFISLPFSFRFKDSLGLDQSYNGVYLNNNGSVSLQAGVTSYVTTAFGTNNLMQFIIAPFFADIDLRPISSKPLRYYAGPNYFIATWDSAGYFNQKRDKLNSFQIILTDGKGQDPFLPAGANILFRYGGINWISDDSNPGSFPKAGYDVGDLIHFYNIPGSNSIGMLNRDNTCFVLPNTSYNNAPVITSTKSNDTLVIPFGGIDSVQFSVTDADAGQVLYTQFDASELCATTLTNTNGTTATAKAVIRGEACNVGTHLLKFTAQDNFQNGSKLRTRDVTVIVGPGTTINLDLVLYIQGYYDGNGTMQPVLFNSGESMNALMSDSIQVELRDPLDPVNVHVYTTTALFKNGQAQLQLPYTFKDKSYYICIRGRNILETWSKNPVTLGMSTTYDFAH